MGHDPTRRGFVFVDILTGLSLLAAVAFALAVGLTARSRAVKRFGDERAAIHLAERAMVALQTGRAPPGDAEVKVTPLATKSGVAGKQWVEVRAVVGGRAATLCGLAPVAKDHPPEANP